MSRGNIGVAVIGGGYGDEGKGLVTGFWAQNLRNPLVIRFNGGAQAGHSRELKDGRRHIFSHFGSGTFEGAPTFLSKYFVINPIQFRREHEAFVKEFGIVPEIYADDECLVTTPVEILINQALETQRGLANHGSCGVGFGETFERVKRTHLLYQLHYMAGISFPSLRDEIKGLIQDYMGTRLDMDRMSASFMEIVNSEQMIDDYWDALMYFKTHVRIDMPYQKQWGRDIIFEGAQGLEIDQDYGVFPFVTRSNCGMRNVSKIIDDLTLDFDHFKVNYVTRAYKTRHGPGPLRHEIHADFPFEDKTNVHNEWQGGLRWGVFMYPEYRSITDKDYALYAREGNLYYPVERVDTMTCMDQLRPEVCTEYENQFKEHFQYFSYGPCSEDVKSA